MKKKYILQWIWFVSMFFLANTYAQVSEYVFDQQNAIYSEINDGITLVTATGADYEDSFDSVIWDLPENTIPFSFIFNGNIYTGCKVSSNGFITFGNITPSGTLNKPLSNAALYDGAVAAWAGDLNGVFHSTMVGSVSYKVEGNTPNREFIIQYKNIRPAFSSSTSDIYSMNFQIRLLETTNKIKIIYGPHSIIEGTGNVSSDRQVGLRGATNADFNNRMNTSSQSFNNSEQGILNNSVQYFNTQNDPPGMPVPGLTYIYTPTPCFRPLTIMVSEVGTNNAVISWVAPTPVPTGGYEYEIRTSGIGGSGSEGLAYTGTTTSGVSIVTLSGLIAETTYNVYVRSLCGTNNYSSWGASGVFSTLCTASDIPYIMPVANTTGTSLPVCVIQQNVNNDNRVWASTTVQTGFSDRVMRYNYHFTNTANDWFYTRGLNLTAGVSYRLKFKYRNNLKAEKLRVSYGASPVNSSMLNELFSVTTSDSPATIEKIVDFIPEITGVYYIGFQVFSDPNKATLYVGDISVDLSPDCLFPAEVIVSNVTKNSAIVSWTSPSTPPTDGYAYELRTSGNPGESEGLVQSGTVTGGGVTKIFQGLLSSTNYYVFIKSVCSAIDSSIWSALQKFKTLCDYPEILTTSSGTICGIGTAILSATGESNIKWYASETGGGAIGNGNSFITPELDATTSYWVSSEMSAGENSTGIKVPPSGSTAVSIEETGIVFNAEADILLNSVSIYSNTSGTVNIKIQNSEGVELYETGNVNVIQGGATVPNIIPLNFTVSAGTGYRMLLKSYTGVNLIRNNITTPAFPFTGEDGNIVITSSERIGTISETYYYYFYDLKYNGICASPRTEVMTIVNSAPPLTLSSAELMLCEGESQSVNVITGASDYDTYIWEPSTGINGNATTGWIFEAPSDTITYTLKASQSTTNCINKQQLIVHGIALPSDLVILPVSTQICTDAITMLEASGGDVGGSFEIGNGTQLTDETSNGPASFNNRWTTFRTQTIYTAAELISAGVNAGTINSLSYNITTDGSSTYNNNYTIKIAVVNEASFTTNNFYNNINFTTVYGPATYTHNAAIGWNEVVFSTPFVWDGISNIVIDVYMNGASGVNSARTYYTLSTNAAVAKSNAMVNGNSGELSDQKLNIRLNNFINMATTWTPELNLYEDVLATIPYKGDYRKKVYFKSEQEGLFDFMATASRISGVSCSKSSSVSVQTSTVSSPIVNAQIFCMPVMVENIPVTVSSDSVVLWYASSTSTSALSVVDNTGTYYVESERSGCKSERVPVLITIVGAQTPPTVSITQSFCDSAMVSDLNVTLYPGFEGRWYATATDTAPLAPSTALVNGGTYYASVYHISSGCESVRVAVKAIITPKPVALPMQQIRLCQPANFGEVSLSTLPGAVLRWYTSLTSIIPIVATQNVTNGVYYVSQVINGCESARSQIQIVIQPNLEKPAAGTQKLCGGGTVSDLTATGAVPGAVYNWYSSVTSTTPLPLTTSLSSGIYYVSQSLTGCESLREAVTVKVFSKQAPVVNAFSFCGTAIVSDLKLPIINNINYKWYAFAASTTELDQDVTLTTGTYYVERVEEGCISDRAAVSVTVLDRPTSPTGALMQSFTVNEMGEATVADLLMDQSNVVWYLSSSDAEAGTNALSALMPLVNGQTYYAVIFGNNGCSSLPTAVTVDITLGTDDFDKKSLTYYPNPVIDLLTIRYKSIIEDVIVYNLVGQKVLTRQNKDNSIEIDMSALAPGSYFVKLRSENYQQTIKIMKQ